MSTHTAHGNANPTSFKCSSKMLMFEKINARKYVRYTSYFLRNTKARMKLKIKFQCTRLSPSNVVSGIQFQICVSCMPRVIKKTFYIAFASKYKILYT